MRGRDGRLAHRAPRVTDTIVTDLTLAPATGRYWSIVLEGERPWTVNGERKMTHHQRADLVRSWRERAAWLAKLERIPHLDKVRIRARPLVRNRAAMQDVGNCYPAVKASIDGLVDVGILANDTPDVVHEILFGASALTGVDGLLLVVEELSPPALEAVQ